MNSRFINLETLAMQSLIVKGFSRKNVILRDLLGIRHRGRPTRDHINGVMEWLCRAQDVNEGSGVSAGYHIFNNKWFTDYPETTGCTIPTFFDIYHLTHREEYFQRAVRMADWECSIQLPEGGVLAGHNMENTSVPAVFNTGQAILGWVRAFYETGEDRFATSCQKAAEWLCRMQDSDGAWRRGRSPTVQSNPSTYNARVAWALVKAGEITSERRYLDAAICNIRWALMQQNNLGWFHSNDFRDNDHPVLHTTAYTIRGLLEVGSLLDVSEFVDKARLSAQALAERQLRNGALYGRYDCNWNPTVGWSCITADAQMAIIWFRLWELVNDRTFLNTARKMVRFLKTTHNIVTNHPGINGGVKGSQPINGEYMMWVYPNWAAKFFADALVLYEKHASD